MKEAHRSYLRRLGLHVKSLMASHGKSAEDVAAHGGLETKQVYRILNGEHSTTITVLHAVAVGIGVRTGELFSFEEGD